MRSYLFVLALCSTFTAPAQSFVAGRIIDSLSLQSVAFANITLEDGRTGTTSDIEGNFRLNIPPQYQGSILITHVTYEKRVLPLSSFSDNVILKLKQSSTVLHEFVVKAGENPAHEIIRKAIRNKKANDPENLDSYAYKSYNKFLLTVSEPTAKADSTLRAVEQKPDSLRTNDEKRFLSFSKIAKSTHFFLSESVTEKKVINPDKQKETLLALQVSGYKSPLFTNVATDYQPLSFYDDNISLLGKSYLNPISQGTFNRYDFNLVDTTYHETDTVYVIQFAPKGKKFFNGLEGIVSVCVDGYAIKNVIASASDSLALTGIRIQQNYEKIDGHWFPQQLNTDIDFHEYHIYGRGLIAQQRSFLRDIRINPPLDKKEFGDITVDLSLPEKETSNQLLQQFRANPITKQETNTYVLLDSVMRKLGWIDKTFETILARRWPIGAFDIDISQLLRLNKYEKVRTGIGIYTNDKFSKVIQPGGYFAYGFGDDEIKYGGELKINASSNKDLYVRLSYRHDIYETGTTHINREGQFLGSEVYRSWVASQFDKITSYKVDVGYRLMQNVHATLTTSRNEIQPTYDYALLINNEPVNTFDITEAGFSVRYVRNENYMNLRNRKILLSQEFPVITAAVTRSIDLFNTPDFTYTRYDLTLKHHIRYRTLGQTGFTLQAGWIDGLAPYGKLYAGSGARSTDLFISNHFQTMGLYEFTSTKYASVFFNHNFGNILINKKHSRPELIVYQHMGIGTLSDSAAHEGVVLTPMKKGYIESGLGLDNILRIKYINIGYMGFGCAVFYRYGPYQLPEQEDNFVVRLNVRFSF